MGDSHRSKSARRCVCQAIASMGAMAIYVLWVGEAGSRDNATFVPRNNAAVAVLKQVSETHGLRWYGTWSSVALASRRWNLCLADGMYEGENPTKSDMFRYCTSRALRVRSVYFAMRLRHGETG